MIKSMHSFSIRIFILSYFLYNQPTHTHIHRYMNKDKEKLADAFHPLMDFIKANVWVLFCNRYINESKNVFLNLGNATKKVLVNYGGC